MLADMHLQDDLWRHFAPSDIRAIGTARDSGLSGAPYGPQLVPPPRIAEPALCRPDRACPGRWTSLFRLSVFSRHSAARAPRRSQPTCSSNHSNHQFLQIPPVHNPRAACPSRTTTRQPTTTAHQLIHFLMVGGCGRLPKDAISGLGMRRGGGPSVHACVHDMVHSSSEGWRAIGTLL